VDTGLEAPSGEDAADRPRVIAGVSVAIEMRLNLDRNSPGTVLVAVGEGDAEGGQHRSVQSSPASYHQPPSSGPPKSRPVR
jgi:hypothetical protein